jgi:pilus assembly protein CpaB
MSATELNSFMSRKVVLLAVAVAIAAVGATLVFMYVRGVDSRAIADLEPVQVLTVTSEITLGESVATAQEQGKLELTEMPSASVLDGALTSTEPIQDAVALSPIYPGEQVLQATFGAAPTGQVSALTVPEGQLAVSVQLDDPARVAGFVTPGSKVAIFASIAAGTTIGTSVTPAFTRVLLPEVEVIGVGETTVSTTTTKAAGGTQTTEEVPKTILTVAVVQDDANKVIFASKNGTLSFGLLPEGTKVRSESGVNMSDLFK